MKARKQERGGESDHIITAVLLFNVFRFWKFYAIFLGVQDD